MQAQLGDQWSSALAQLARLSNDMQRAQPGLAEKRFNPHPPGVLRFACGAHAVLAVLSEDPGSVLPRSQLIERTGMSRKTVDAAIECLRRAGAIEAVELPDHMRRRRVCGQGQQGPANAWMGGRLMSGASAPRLGFRKGAADPQIADWHLSRLSLQQRVANFMNH